MANVVAPCGGIILSDKFKVENGVIDIQAGGQVQIPKHNELQGRDEREAHPISAINGLSQVIDTLNNTKKTIYVDTQSANIVQNGSSLYPYVDLQTAQSSVNPTRQVIVIKSGSSIVEDYSTETNLLQLLGSESDFTGTLTIQKNNFEYVIKNHIGDIIVNSPCRIVILGNLIGNITCTVKDCDITVLGELHGNITCEVEDSMLIRAGRFDSATNTISNETAIRDGSIIGNQTYGLIAKR